VSARSASRYVSLKKIADGGMAEIFLAHQSGAQGFARSVIVKRIRPGLSADPQFRDMLIDEAHIAMRLSHRNVVPVLDLGQSRGRYFLVMDLVDGWDLSTVLRRVANLGETFPLALGLYVVAEICRGLAYAHAHTGRDGKVLGIIHRDVSPHNVLLSEQGNVKLTDFGVAKALGKRDQTRTGIIKGKLDFMSPEQASGLPLAPSSDIFAVGTILYLLASGRRPFAGDSDLDVLNNVQRAEFTPLVKAAPRLSRGVVRIVNRAMRSNPADRYQSAEAMMMDIEKVLRRDLGSPGQSELKRWLADLATRDGAPPASGLPALPVDEPLGPIGHDGTETLELDDSAIVSCSTDPLQQAPGRLAPLAVARPTPPPVPRLPSRQALRRLPRPGLRALLLLAVLGGVGSAAFQLTSPDSVAATVDGARTLLREANVVAFTATAEPSPAASQTPPAPPPPPPRPRIPQRHTARVAHTDPVHATKAGRAPAVRRLPTSRATRAAVADLRRHPRRR
jgi:serine/threonine-protein kinase